MKRSVLLFVLCHSLFLFASPALAQEPPLWPGAKYDPAIPTIKSVLGHDHGEVITPPEGVAQYLQALQKAAPTKTRLIQYATTWEGRPLWLFVIGQSRSHREARSAESRHPAFRRPAEGFDFRWRSPRTRAAGRRLADARRPRQRDLVV
jgi:hypothetical protein